MCRIFSECDPPFVPFAVSRCFGVRQVDDVCSVGVQFPALRRFAVGHRLCVQCAIELEEEALNDMIGAFIIGAPKNNLC